MIEVFSKRTDKPHAYGFNETTMPPFTPIEVSISPDGKQWNSMFDQPDLEGIYFHSHDVANANMTDTYQKIGINDGQYLVSSSYEQRDIKASAVFWGIDDADVKLAYDAMQRFFISRDPYWICFSDWPQRMYYAKPKQITPTYVGNRGYYCDLVFTDQIGLSRSVGTTANFEHGFVNGFGNNMPIDRPKYVFNSDHFTVVNFSDVLIDPEKRGHPFKITFQGSTSGDMTVKNNTTNLSITRKGAWSGTWCLDGTSPLLNGQADGINTDHGVITLQKGNNDFTVTGFSGTITFDYPMWWLS